MVETDKPDKPKWWERTTNAVEALGVMGTAVAAGSSALLFMWSRLQGPTEHGVLIASVTVALGLLGYLFVRLRRVSKKLKNVSAPDSQADAENAQKKTEEEARQAGRAEERRARRAAARVARGLYASQFRAPTINAEMLYAHLRVRNTTEYPIELQSISAEVIWREDGAASQPRPVSLHMPAGSVIVRPWDVALVTVEGRMVASARAVLRKGTKPVVVQAVAEARLVGDDDYVTIELLNNGELPLVPAIDPPSEEVIAPAVQVRVEDAGPEPDEAELEAERTEERKRV